MARGHSKTKIIKQAVNQEGLNDIFGQLLGDEKSLDINIVKDKYNKLKTNLERVFKLFESFKNTIYGKILVDDPNVSNYIEKIEGFIEDCKHTTNIEVNDSNITKVYLSLKDNKIIADCIHICKNLIIHKKYISDNENLSDNFIKSSKTKDLAVFPFCNFDIKFFYLYGKVDDSVKKYILIFLNMMFNTTYEIYQIITTPDIDIEKFSSIIIDTISNTQKMIPRTGKAFKKIKESVELLQNNFNDYYKDFVSTKDPTSIITSFLLDCKSNGNDDNEQVDVELARQFMRITAFYRKQSAGKINDPRINQIFELLDKNFKMLDIKEEDDTSGSDSEE